MLINGKVFDRIDTRDRLTIADSFVVPSNKLGKGNGEGKFYIGNDNQQLRFFFGDRGFQCHCFFLREDLVRFLDDLKSEYTKPQLPYRRKDELLNLFFKRMEKVLNLPAMIVFEIIDQSQLTGPRVYVNSSDKNYNLIRELALPNLSYLSLMKLRATDGETIYYVKPFTDYRESFGVTAHPADIKASEEMIEQDRNLNADEKLTVVKARVGQGKYRKQLLDECPFCPITLVSDDRLLIASHIKPWAHSDNLEKIDPKNGFMFTPTIDYLFDQGFITFEDSKRLILSPWLSKPTVNRLNLAQSQLVTHLPVAGREGYLQYHRQKIFKS